MTVQHAAHTTDPRISSRLHLQHDCCHLTHDLQVSDDKGTLFFALIKPNRMQGSGQQQNNNSNNKKHVRSRAQRLDQIHTRIFKKLPKTLSNGAVGRSIRQHIRMKALCNHTFHLQNLSHTVLAARYTYTSRTVSAAKQNKESNF